MPNETYGFTNSSVTKRMRTKSRKRGLRLVLNFDGKGLLSPELSSHVAQEERKEGGSLPLTEKTIKKGNNTQF